jgi:hypothetical protein
MKLFLTFLCLSIVAQAHTLTAPKVVPSNIMGVTVFLQGAQVTRNALTTLDLGKTELVFRGISPQIDPQSIQVKGDGAFTILSVQHQINYLEEQKPRSEVEQLKTTQKQLMDKRRLQNVGLEVCKNEQVLLNKNQTVAGSNTGMKAADLREVIAYKSTQMQQTQLKMIDLLTTIQQLNDTIAKIDKQLAELNERKNKQTSEIHVIVTANAPSTAQFTISYLVQEASWYATYDVRAKNISQPINLQYKANVQQQSGEDWTDVKLILSTGNPSLGGTKPTLPPWQLRFGNTYTGYRPSKAQAVVGAATNTTGSEIRGVVRDARSGEPLPFVNVSVAINGSMAGAQTDFDGYYSIKPIPAGEYSVKASYVGYNNQQMDRVLVRSDKITFLDMQISESSNVLEAVEIVAYKEPLLQADQTSTGSTYNRESRASSTKSTNVNKKQKPTAPTISQANVNENPTNISFDIKLPYIIPNDGKTYVVDINQYDVPATYRYYCVPKIDPDAFLTAEITNWEELNLLPGEANLFFEGTFVGKSSLNPNRTQDTLFLSLGRDKSIVIERTKQKDFNKRPFIGANRTEARTFEIAIRNKKTQTIHLALEDQVPLSTDKDIEVEVETDKEAKKNNDTGAVTWELDLPPATEKKLLLKYQVKYPKSKTLVLE